jgi:hypothetical protein
VRPTARRSDRAIVPITRRRLRHLARPSTWTTVATDLEWTLRREPTLPRRPSSWPVDDEEIAGWEIRWPATYGCKRLLDPIRSRLARRIPVIVSELPQIDPVIVTFQVRTGSGTFDVAIDPWDYPDRIGAFVESFPLYFKLQYLRDGYGYGNVVPGGYVEPRGQLVRFLPLLRRRRDEGRFSFDVYGRFSLKYAPAVRRPALELLQGQNRFRYEGGSELVLLTRFLRNVGRSKVCVDLPGNGPFCHRLIDYLAVGTCVVAVPHASILHVPLVDREHIAYCRPDLSDLVDLCAYYVDNDAERERLARNSRDFYDRYLSWDQLADYYLSRLVERLG